MNRMFVQKLGKPEAVARAELFVNHLSSGDPSPLIYRSSTRSGTQPVVTASSTQEETQLTPDDRGDSVLSQQQKVDFLRACSNIIARELEHSLCQQHLKGLLRPDEKINQQTEPTWTTNDSATNKLTSVVPEGSSLSEQQAEDGSPKYTLRKRQIEEPFVDSSKRQQTAI